ncbi:hypothetical protein [Methylosinus sp. R-45379]|uniref:hypothetical protein n=1 Tax=Methylosinus sp. R-45379 TaxID=980563 RepID=UPI000A93135C|nr:hypothetical protein [Methylosinus sp. R-45379]
MATEHHIDLMSLPATGGSYTTSCRGRYSAGKRPHTKTAIYLGSKMLGASYRPIEEAGRHLLANGIASPGDVVVFWRDGKRCLTLTAGEAATPRNKGKGSMSDTQAAE